MAEDHSPPRTTRWRKGYEEIVVAAVLLVGAIFFRLRIDTFVNGRDGAFLNPTFWPATLLTIGIVLCAVYLVLAVIWARREGAVQPAVEPTPVPADAQVAAPVAAGGSHGSTAVGAVAPDPAAPVADPAPHADEEPHTGSIWKALAGLALMAAYVYLLGPIGFIPASILFSIGFMLLVGERRWYVLLIFPVVAVSVLLGVFTQLLVVALPRGTGVFVDLSTYFY